MSIAFGGRQQQSHVDFYQHFLPGIAPPNRNFGALSFGVQVRSHKGSHTAHWSFQTLCLTAKQVTRGCSCCCGQFYVCLVGWLVQEHCHRICHLNMGRRHRCHFRLLSHTMGVEGGDSGRLLTIARADLANLAKLYTVIQVKPGAVLFILPSSKYGGCPCFSCGFCGFEEKHMAIGHGTFLGCPE